MTYSNILSLYSDIQSANNRIRHFITEFIDGNKYLLIDDPTLNYFDSYYSDGIDEFSISLLRMNSMLPSLIKKYESAIAEFSLCGYDRFALDFVNISLRDLKNNMDTLKKISIEFTDPKSPLYIIL